MSFTLPKRPKRLRQRELEEEEAEKAAKQTQVSDTAIQEILDRKKRRREMDKELERMRASLKQDMLDTASDDIRTLDDGNKDSRSNKDDDDIMFYITNEVHKSNFDDGFMLDKSNDSDDENGAEALREAAKIFLGEEAQENINLAINEANNTEVVEATELWHQSFFKPGSKNIRQPRLISREEGIGEKEMLLSEMSATASGRAFLLQWGSMKDWHSSGWKCPSYVYQWLFEVVALELDKNTARNALSTLFALWSLPGSKVETQLPYICKQRYIQISTFKSILLAYNALPAALIEGVLSDPDSQDTKIHAKIAENYDGEQARHLPVSQLGWMVKALGFSVRLWSKAYTTYEIRYAVRLLVQLSLDETGHLVLQEIQIAIDNCLAGMKGATWETELKAIANDICDMVPSTKRQVHTLDCVRMVNPRSHYFRRIVAVTCLERSLEQEVPGSVDYISTDQSLIRQIHQIFMNKDGFFMKRDNMDFEECFVRLSMLDAAISVDDDEIRRDSQPVLEIADELHKIGLSIGAHIGVMKKTLAKEIIQRVCSRLTFLINKNVRVAF
ncbi:uncharacterized protein ATC70_001041 [Mucor velutinosus]|uniref:Coiled-coil SMC6 And NSE5 INteracting (CANIN) domain-containing protein n=1 Tax=Mucor velutinosus TaxID=708070 RepID=A0AAN7HUA8_9FUNG|nr:hypothetical protein ATC70_001041 [Mucor velutinosus]